MEAGDRLWLDELERLSEETRRALGVSTLSISRFVPAARSLGTFVNAGVLAADEARRPTRERYPLHQYPAAAALVRYRRPYLSTPELPGDVASLALEAALGKNSQAAAPLVIGDTVWGEFWVASAANDLPLGRGELPLVCWAADRFSARLAELLDDLAPSGFDDDVAAGQHRYEIWIDGALDPELVMAVVGVPARSAGAFTLVSGDFEVSEISETVSRLCMLGFVIAGVCRDDASIAPLTSSNAARRVYEIRLAGRFDHGLFEEHFDMTAWQAGSFTSVSGRLDSDALADVVTHAHTLGAELVSITARA